MDPIYSLQDLVRCDLCESAVPPLYCDICHIHLCKSCTADHILEESKDHRVVPVKRRNDYSDFPLCLKHSVKQCELYCEQCEIPICTDCVPTGFHQGHKTIDIMKTYHSQKETILKDLKELEIFLPRYQEIAYDIPVQKADVYRNSQELTTAIRKRGDDWHKQIDAIIRRKKLEINEIEIKCLAVLQKQEYEITNMISKITHCILDLNIILDSNDFCLALAYKSKNEKFRNSLPKFKVIYPSFSSQKIYEEQLCEQFGSLSVGAITTESGDLVEYLRVMPPPLDGPSADQRHIITSINTGYCCLYKGVCLNDKRIWTFGNNNIIKMYNSQGELLKSVQTKSWNIPSDITLSVSEDLVYTDYYDKSVNVVKENRIEEVIKLWRWRPLNICTTFSGDLLVTLICDDNKQSQIVRYSGSTEKQIIQFDEEGQPLFSTAQLGAICENRNLDICVIDIEASAVVVVNHAGKFRFKYIGPKSDSTSENAFDPVGITTGSQSHILISDYDNHRIHIVDQDGQFLCYIDQIDIRHPYGLYMDLNDILYVTEFDRVIRDDKKQSQILRYSGSGDKQNSQFEDEGHPLFSTAQFGTICENRNLDISVVGIEAFKILVVNQAGKLRVKYTDSVSESTSEKSFDLVGIPTGTTEARFSSQTMTASDQYC